MIRIHDVEQGTEEWHRLREGLYTGSNAYKLLRYGAIEYSRSSNGSFRGNFYTKRGHILEDEAIDIYGTITGKCIQRPGFITNSLYRDCGYSPDGLALLNGDRPGIIPDGVILLEVKCFNEKKHRAISGGEIPLEIMAQIHFGLLITGIRKARLILYNPDIDAESSLKIVDVPFNRNIQENFKRRLKEASSARHTQTAYA